MAGKKKLPVGWTAHGGYWRFMENGFGISVESVVRFTKRGQTRYEAHYWDDACCGFANNPSDFWRSKTFDNREDAFAFCEEKYRQRMAKKEGARWAR